MHEQKYRYFIDGKEISTREEYFNTTMSGDYVSYFDGDSVFSVSFSNFFGENKDNNKMIKREVNSHLSDVLDLVQVKGSSTRHKSQNGETHKELTVEEKLKVAEGFKKEALKQLNITLEDIKTQSSQSYYTSQEQKEKIKADWIDFIGNGMKRGKTINYENSAEKTEKEENTVFPKDSEIHKEELEIDFSFLGTPKEIHDALSLSKWQGIKEELPPFTTNYPDDYLEILTDIYTGNGQRPETFTVGEGVNEGIKESNGKTDYSEINLEILDLMAERFTANKHKYPQGNMKKPIDIKSLEWALFRHVKKMIQPIETDEESYKDHLSAVLCNASMILDQLKNNG